MLLAQLAATAEAVGATSKRKEKTALLASVIGDLAPDEIEPAIGFLTGSPRQGRIGVGWATLVRVEAEVAEAAAGATLTVADLDRLLDDLAVTTGTGSAAGRSALLGSVMARATKAETKWLQRILLGEVRQGALAGVVTDAVAAAAGVKAALLRRAVMLLGDLGGAAAIALTEGADGLAKVDLVVGRPIQPMLASTAADIAGALDGLGPVQVDWKLDGARIQVHVDDDRVGIYTRNLNDVTGRLGHVAALVRSFDCSSAVLDGEVLGFVDIDADAGAEDAGAADDEDGAGEAGSEAPQPFQQTMSAFGTHAPGTDPVDTGPLGGLRPFFFDLMLVDGVSLIDRPLSERTAALDRVVGPHRVPRVVTDDADEAATHLAAALEAGHEGVMVKGIDGVYEAGRRGKSWRKVKPVHTLDLVVLAAEWGHGRRRGWLSNLHLGARDPATGDFVMVGKTFKGLTDELLRTQTAEFLARKVSESGHTVHVVPELVIEIALDGVQTSTRYPGGVALRFARVRRYRPDKQASEADTIDTVRNFLTR